VRAEAVALPRRVRWPPGQVRVSLVRLAPSRRSLAIGLGILAVAFGAYGLARETSLFAIDRIEVRGGSPRVSAEVRGALASLVGTSLVGLDGAAVLRRVDALPSVVRASYDRAFPHTLRISIVPERPAVVLRSGSSSWLVSARGRVLQQLTSTVLPRLPRVWVAARTPVRVGAELRVAGAGVAARAVSLAGAFATRIASASFAGGSLVVRLRSGFELVLGDPSQVRLKLAVAESAIPALPAGPSFLDVSVPGRPISGTGTPALYTTADTQQGSSRG
jgi:cell division protein FtsQ